MCIWAFRSIIIDSRIAKGGPITPSDAAAILNKAIKIHNWFIEITWDDPYTGDDDLHNYWIWWYEQIIALLRGGEAVVSVDDAIEKLKEDAIIHQWYIDNPQYAVGIYGNVSHHTKWRDRWLAIVILLRSDIEKS
ncbi:hypothetical protein ES703_66814 [subsurface metagenome]